MQNKYQQSAALWAITKASFLSILKNPGSIFFSLLFPLLFVLIFGAFSEGKAPSFTLSLSPQSDTQNVFFQTLKQLPYIQWKNYPSVQEQKNALEKGKIAAILTVVNKNKQDSIPLLDVKLVSTTATYTQLQQLMPLFENLADKLEKKFYAPHPPLVNFQPTVYEVRKYRQIDFVLPGQIGFSLLFATLFGISFTFYNLREQLVLKRFYATPVSKLNILIGIGFSRVSFQLLNVIVLVLFGHLVLNFTLAHGIITFLQILILSILLLFLLMGVGLLFSSIVKADNTIPLYINMFGLPQILLSGTFFSITVFPNWMQQLVQVLPLTQFNEAIRKISFEGAYLWDCWLQISVLLVWIFIVYALVKKYFKWE